MWILEVITINERGTIMFFNITKLKKMFKEAYKSYWGLTIAHLENEDYYIKGPNGVWMIKYRAGFMPKEVKGALIEIAGDLPDSDCILNAIEGEASQYEFIDTFGTIDDSFNYDPKTVKEYKDSHISNTMMGRTFVVNSKYNEPAKEVSSGLIDVISFKNLEEKEMKPEGPYMISTSPYFIYQNYQCTYIVMPHSTNVEDELKLRKYIGEAMYKEEE